MAILLFEEILALESPINVEFKKQLDLIKDQRKKQIVANILRQSSMRNIDEPASSTGKYHPSYAHGKRGLSRHVKAVIRNVRTICNAFPDELNEDSMIIAAMLHDICKYKDEGRYTSKTHAADIADLLQKNGLDTEARLTRTHMGHFDKKVKGPEQFDEQMLHLADYFASQKYLHISFNTEDEIVEENDDPEMLVNKFNKMEDENARFKYEDDFRKGLNDGF